jgi:hypothetical protein
MFVIGLLLGIFVVGKLSINEILKIIGEILPIILRAETLGSKIKVAGEQKKIFAVKHTNKELSAGHKSFINTLLGGTGRIVESIFINIAQPILKSEILKRIK